MKKIFVDLVSHENIDNIVVAYLFALIIRCFFIDVFQIPTASMEPTLMGDQKDKATEKIISRGDKIIATKFSYLVRPVERYDVAIFRFPLNIQRNFIKRIVGLPDEELTFKRGNIYAKRDPTRDFAIARKPLSVQESIWIDSSDSVHTEDLKIFDDNWQPNTLQGKINRSHYTVKERVLTVTEDVGILFSIRSEKRPMDRAGHTISDLKLSFECQVGGDKGVVFAELRNEIAIIYLHLSSQGSWLRVDATNRHGSIKRDLSSFRMTANNPVQVELISYDGICIARLNGRIEAEVEYVTTMADISNATREFELAFGVKDSSLNLKSLQVKRDLYYYGDANVPDEIAVKIGKESYLVVGDNVKDSHDGRKWKEYQFKLRDGRTIICEGQEIADMKEREIVAKRFKIETPDYVIKADINGNFVYFNDSDLVSKNGPVARMFVGSEHIVARAFIIWWPSWPFTLFTGGPSRSKLIK